MDKLLKNFWHMKINYSKYNSDLTTNRQEKIYPNAEDSFNCPGNNYSQLGCGIGIHYLYDKYS